MRKNQTDLVAFALRYPDKWHSFADNLRTTSIVCATQNIGIIRVNEFGQFRLACADKAQRFLNSRECN